MVFSSLLFLFCFLPVTFAVYYIAPVRLKNAVLLVASLVFYSWGEIRFFPVMIAVILVNYFAGLAIGRWKRNRALSRAGVLRVRFDLRDHLLRLLLQRRLFGVDGSQTLAMLRDLRLQRIDAIGLFGDLQAHPFDRFGAVAHIRAQNGGGRFALRRGGLRLGKAGARRLRLQIFFPHFLRKILRRRIKLLQLALRAGEIVLCRPIVAVHRLGLLLQAVERLHPDGDL